LLHLFVFHAHVNETQVQKAKSPVKNIVRQRCAEGFNSGVKGLKTKVTVGLKDVPAWNKLGPVGNIWIKLT
jgi:hypothetical protein